MIDDGRQEGATTTTTPTEAGDNQHGQDQGGDCHAQRLKTATAGAKEVAPAARSAGIPLIFAETPQGAVEQAALYVIAQRGVYDDPEGESAFDIGWAMFEALQRAAPHANVNAPATTSGILTIAQAHELEQCQKLARTIISQRKGLRYWDGPTDISGQHELACQAAQGEARAAREEVHDDLLIADGKRLGETWFKAVKSAETEGREWDELLEQQCFNNAVKHLNLHPYTDLVMEARRVFTQLKESSYGGTE